MSPVKETNFFAGYRYPLKGPGDDEAIRLGIDRNADGSIREQHAAIINSLEEYAELFAESGESKARGEISPSYLFVPEAADRIKAMLPEVKILVLLRNPVKRAFSNYATLFMSGRETEELEIALSKEEERLRKGYEHFWAYKGLGLYYDQTRRYVELFGRSRVGIWLYEDMSSDPVQIFQEICRFIGVDDSFAPDLSRHNVSTRQESEVVLQLRRNVLWKRMKWILPEKLREMGKRVVRTLTGTRKLEMKPSTRRYLLEFYRADILKLHALLPELGVTRWIEEEEQTLRKLRA
jgi:hypothetical protein